MLTSLNGLVDMEHCRLRPHRRGRSRASVEMIAIVIPFVTGKATGPITQDAAAPSQHCEGSMKMDGQQLIAAGIACAMTLMNPSANAEPQGRDLRAWCNSQPGSMEDAVCRAYLGGFLSGLIASEHENGKICLLQYPSADEIRRLLPSIYGNNNAALNLEAKYSLAVAAELAWPCR